MAPRRVAPWMIAVVLCAAGSLGAHTIGYWLEPSGPAAAVGHAWFDLLPALAVGGIVALFAALAVQTGEIVRSRAAGSVPGWVYLVLPAAAFLVQEHLERAIATAQVPADTLAQPAVLAGLALQLPFGVAALVAARLLSRATAAIARRIGPRDAPHVDRPDERPHRTDLRPRRVEHLQPVGRGPPVFAVP